MAIGKLDHIQFGVNNLKEATKFFTEKLGFERMPPSEGPGPRIATLRSPAGDLLFDLEEVTEEIRKRGAEPFSARTAEDHVPGRSYVNHICFAVDDLDKEYEELKSKGVEFLGPPYTTPGRGRYRVNLFDPDRRFLVQLIEVTSK